MPTDPIQHIVVLMLENNSFDRMLGCMTAVYPNLVRSRSGTAQTAGAARSGGQRQAAAERVEQFLAKSKSQ